MYLCHPYAFTSLQFTVIPAICLMGLASSLSRHSNIHLIHRGRVLYSLWFIVYLLQFFKISAVLCTDVIFSSEIMGYLVIIQEGNYHLKGKMLVVTLYDIPSNLVSILTPSTMAMLRHLAIFTYIAQKDLT